MNSVTDWLVLDYIEGTAPRLGSYPYRALKGLQPREEWNDVLYHSSASDSQDFHLDGES